MLTFRHPSLLVQLILFSGSYQSIATIIMMREGFIAPSLSLENPDPALPPLSRVMGEPKD